MADRQALDHARQIAVNSLTDLLPVVCADGDDLQELCVERQAAVAGSRCRARWLCWSLGETSGRLMGCHVPNGAASSHPAHRWRRLRLRLRSRRGDQESPGRGTGACGTCRAGSRRGLRHRPRGDRASHRARPEPPSLAPRHRRWAGRALPRRPVLRVSDFCWAISRRYRRPTRPPEPNRSPRVSRRDFAAIPSPIRPRHQQESGIAATSRLTPPKDALRRFTLVRDHHAPTASSRPALTEAHQRQPTAPISRPVNSGPRPCHIDVGSPCPGPRTGLPPPISTTCLAHSRRPAAGPDGLPLTPATRPALSG